MKQSKSFYTFCAVLSLVVVCLSCGGDPAQAGQVGIALYDQPVVHGHSDPTDGGALNVPSFHVYRSTLQTVSSGVNTVVDFDVEVMDTNSTFDIAVDRHIPIVSGKYLYIGTVCGMGSTTMTRIGSLLRKNGAAIGLDSFLALSFTASSSSCVTTSIIVSMNGTTDYVQLLGRVDGTGTLNMQGNLSGVMLAR